MVSLVYMVTNLVNGHRYIGMTTKTPERRKAVHVTHIRAGGFECPRFYGAVRKYGERNFQWEVITYFKDVEEARQYEYYIVNKINPEYNAIDGGWFSVAGGGWNKIKVLCLETGEKFDSMMGAARAYGVDGTTMWDAIKGKGKTCCGNHFIVHEEMSEEERFNRIDAMDKAAAGGRRKVAAIKLAYRGVIGGRDKKGRSAAGPMKLAKAVMCLDDGRIYPSANAASREYKVHNSIVSEVCRGVKGRKTASGFRFKYIGDGAAP